MCVVVDGLCKTQVGVKSLGHIGDSRSHDGKQKPPIYGGFRRRMKGLEPSTFCMASESWEELGER
jgi:hypothetical protein